MPAMAASGAKSPVTLPADPVFTPSRPLFVGDFSTGDFSQWPVVQNRVYNSRGVDYDGQFYGAQVVDDPTYGKAARIEIRAGDVPSFGGGERSEIQGDPGITGGGEGETFWYEFAVKFDSQFPMNHADLGWGLVNQFDSQPRGQSPLFGWYVDHKNGYWSLVAGKGYIVDLPLNPDVWQHIKMRVLYSADDTKGALQAWLNGQPLVFTNGETVYHVRTLYSSGAIANYQFGYYRKPMAPTGVVYHAGFRCAKDEAGLALNPPTS